MLSWPDEPTPLDLPDGEALCDCCWEPAPDLREGLCASCRCAACGDPAALIEHHDARLCRPCAIEAGWCPSLALEAAE